MATIDELKATFKTQIVQSLENNYPNDPEMQCAFAAGMLVVVSAMRAKDGPTLAMQMAVFHSALREVGNDKGWGVASNGV